jgi:hypothetical protein
MPRSSDECKIKPNPATPPLSDNASALAPSSRNAVNIAGVTRNISFVLAAHQIRFRKTEPEFGIF